MKRKINLVGKNTLTVSLPNGWVFQNHLKKGDELEYKESNKEITFSIRGIKQSKKSITINIDNYDRYMLDRLMKVLYRNNYDHIVFTYTKRFLPDYKIKQHNGYQYIKKLSNHFIGLEIISQDEFKTELSCFIENNIEKIETIEKRIYFLIKETLTNLIGALEENFNFFDDNVYDYHDNITKFINYYLRSIDQLEISESEKKQIYSLYMLIDKLIDKIRHLSKAIKENGCTPRIKDYLQKVFSLLDQQFMSFYKNEMNIEILKERLRLREYKFPKLTTKELEVIKECDLMLNMVNDFAETILAKKLHLG